MAIDVVFETKEVEKMIEQQLSQVKKPRELILAISKWIDYMTKKFFFGRRPDNVSVRGVRWPKLKQSTIDNKKNLVKRGKAIVAERPMVSTGAFRDSIKVLEKNKKGFLFGTRKKSKGFNYPGYHNSTKFPWLFISKKEYDIISEMTVDFIKKQLRNFRFYAR